MKHKEGGEGGIGISRVNPASPATPSFESQGQLDQWVSIRAVRYAQEINSTFQLIDRIKGPHLEIKSPHWSPVLDQTTLASGGGFAIGLNPDAPLSPSAALLDLIGQGGGIDCAIAISLALTRMELDLLGQDTFDRSCASSGLRVPRRSLLLTCVRPKGMPEYPGELGLIINVPEYIKLHPAGVGFGENVFATARMGSVVQCVGFGDFFKEPRRTEEIIESLRRATLQAPVHPDQLLSPKDGLPIIREERYKEYCKSYFDPELVRIWDSFRKSREIWCERRKANEWSSYTPVYKIDLEKLQSLTNGGEGE